jgi:hypothetical protein
MSIRGKGKMRRFSGYTLSSMVFLIIALVHWEGCTLFSTKTRTARMSAAVERKQNGYLLKLPPGNRDPQVEALITHRRWVIVTIVDPLYDTAPLSSFSSVHVDSLYIDRFNSAVQVAVRFRREVEAVSVIDDPDKTAILISVFEP